MGILGNADVSGIVAIIASGRLSNSKSGTVIAGSRRMITIAPKVGSFGVGPSPRVSGENSSLWPGRLASTMIDSGLG